MRLEFSYIRKGHQYFPVIDLKLRGPKAAIKIKALVDSGASYSVFRAEVAEYLGINIEKGRPIYLEGIGGRILGYMHYLPILIGSRVYKSKIVFSRELTVSFNILGRDNFFIPFLVTFSEKAKKVIIEDYKS